MSTRRSLCGNWYIPFSSLTAPWTHSKSKMWYGNVLRSVSHGCDKECCVTFPHHILIYRFVHVNHIGIQKRQRAFKMTWRTFWWLVLSHNSSEIVKIINWKRVYANHKAMGVGLYRPPLVLLSFDDFFQNGKLDIFKYQVFLTQKRKIWEEEDRLIDACTNINGI